MGAGSFFASQQTSCPGNYAGDTITVREENRNTRHAGDDYDGDDARQHHHASIWHGTQIALVLIMHTTQRRFQARVLSNGVFSPPPSHLEQCEGWTREDKLPGCTFSLASLRMILRHTAAERTELLLFSRHWRLKHTVTRRS